MSERKGGEVPIKRRREGETAGGMLAAMRKEGHKQTDGTPPEYSRDTRAQDDASETVKGDKQSHPLCSAAQWQGLPSFLEHHPACP